MSEIFVGDVLAFAATLAPASIDTIVTSPPFYRVRDYGLEGQIGLEETPWAFVERLRGVFAALRPALRDDGTLFVNMGDVYNNRTKVRKSSHNPALNGFTDTHWRDESKRGGVRMTITKGGLKEKDLMGVPWLLAFALQADGWWLRSEIIWHKPRSKPESVTDRPSRSHEQIFLLSKSKIYRFDELAMRRLVGTGNRASGTVWSVPVNVSAAGHVAAFPPEIVRPCVVAGAPIGGVVCDPFCGSGTTMVVAEQEGRGWVACDLDPTSPAKLGQRRIGMAV